MKREGASTLFIHGFPWALNRLSHFLKIALCCVFENILKSCQREAELCNDSHICPRECVQSGLKIF